MSRCLLLFLTALTAACVDFSAPGPLENTARLRFVNLITDDAKVPVDVYLDEEPFGDSLAFGGASPHSLAPFNIIYQEVTFGSHTIKLRRSGDTTVVGQYTFILEAPDNRGVEAVFPDSVAAEVFPGGYELDRTVYATGSGGFTPVLTSDANAIPAPGTIRVRVLNLSPVAGEIDVFVTPQTSDISLAIPSVTGVRAGDFEYFTVSPGTWRVRAVRTGVAPGDRAANLMMSLSNLVWENGARTIAIVDAPNLIQARGAVVVDR